MWVGRGEKFWGVGWKNQGFFAPSSSTVGGVGGEIGGFFPLFPPTNHFFA